MEKKFLEKIIITTTTICFIFSLLTLDGNANESINTEITVKGSVLAQDGGILDLEGEVLDGVYDEDANLLDIESSKTSDSSVMIYIVFAIIAVMGILYLERKEEIAIDVVK